MQSVHMVMKPFPFQESDSGGRLLNAELFEPAGPGNLPPKSFKRIGQGALAALLSLFRTGADKLK